MGLLNTYEVTLKVRLDVEASSEESAARYGQEELEDILISAGASAYCKVVDVDQRTNYV